MRLTERQKYKLTVILAQLLAGKGMEKTICDDTVEDTDPNDIILLDYASINFPPGAISEEDRWACIIKAADGKKLVEKLLEVVIKYYNGDAELNSFYEDLKNGFDNRIKKIAWAIAHKECVLFIGPELLQCKNGANIEAFNRLFARDITGKLNKNKIYYDKGQSNSLSYIADRYESIKGASNRDMGKLALSSFNASKPMLYRNAYDKIAQLNFRLIISTNPDDILEEEYQKRGLQKDVDFISGFYDRSNQNRNAAAYDENKKMIYKIFGSFQSHSSILFTDNDRVQFSKNVVKDNPQFPPEIKVALENKYYLFLGFDFQEWHLKILIDCLGLTKADKEEKSFALLLDNVNDSNIEHFERNYKFYFINKDIETFLDDVINTIPTIP
jgi:hypothetical protein